jgi:hypothetical protein
MTIITTQSRITYAGDNVSTLFPVPFEFFLNSDLTVSKTAVNGAVSTLTLNIDFTLAGANVPGGGSLTKTTALLTGEIMAIYLNPPISQQSHYISNSPFPSATLENDIDRQTQISQRLQDQISRSVRAPDGDAAPGMLLASATLRALMYLAFDANGNAVTVPSLPGSAITQQSLGIVLNPQSPAEIAVGVTPTLYFYPVGHLLRYGADATGAGSSWTAFNNCAKVCQKTGNTMTVPPGDFLIDTVNGSITLQYLGLLGTSVNDTYNQNNQGSVLNITGTVNSPFKLQAGAKIDGVVFYYPNNITDGVTPTVYPPTLSVDITNGPVNYVYIQNCVAVNAYRFFVDADATGGLGHVFITDNTIYGILSCIEIAYNAEICTIEGNEFTFGAFNVAQLETNPSFRFTSRTTGSAMIIKQTDGLTIQGNVFFGYLNGINCPIVTGGNGGVIQQTTIGNNYFDQTVFGINVSGPGNWNIIQITGNFFSGYDNVSAQHNLIGNCVKVATSGAVSQEVVTITGNTFAISTGDSVNVTGATPQRQYVCSGNTFTQWGIFQTTGGPYAGWNYSGAGSSCIVTGNSFIGCGGSVGICTGILGACSSALINSNAFLNSGAGALGITGVVAFTASNLIVTANFSAGQSGGTWDDNLSATTLYEIGNIWGRRTFGSPFVVPLAAWTQAANDAAAAAASPPVPVGALYYNTTVTAVKVRLT